MAEHTGKGLQNPPTLVELQLRSPFSGICEMCDCLIGSWYSYRATGKYCSYQCGKAKRSFTPHKPCKNCKGLIPKGRQGKYCSNLCGIHYAQKIKFERTLLRFKDISTYRYLCRFAFGLRSFPRLFDFEAIGRFGMYHPVTNPFGVSKDHRYSVRDGFMNEIEPEILAHPVNCRLIFHKDNQRKRAMSVITLEQLKKEITDFERAVGDRR